jgi:hypothetical protein|tara:strand:- start:44 stop:448 length:405 start_codon:yes stop_codon:yes gene_type:complete
MSKSKSILKARVFPCGHANSTSKNNPQQVLARTEGHCCYAWQLASEKAVQVEYGVPQLAVDWYVRGLTYPIPEQRRRSKESEATGGWPGLCCDPDTGLYIGGVGNNCRFYHKGPERCIVHFREVKNKTSEESAE